MDIKIKQNNSDSDKKLSKSVRRSWDENSFWGPIRRGMAIEFPQWEFPIFEGMFSEREGGWFPKADFSETDKEIKIKVDLPNVDPKDVSVEVDDHSISISGSTEKEEEDKGETWYRAERSYGEFKRVFALPNNVNRNKIKAESKNGTLFIEVPKTEISEKRKIDVAKK